MTDRLKAHLPALVAAAFGMFAVAALAPSTALADHGDCGQPESKGHRPASVDALVILKVSVHATTCGDQGDDCECDVNDSGSVTPADALIVLRTAVGFPASLSCHPGCGGPGTTILGQTTTTEVDNGDNDDNGDNQGPTTTEVENGDNDDGGDHQGDETTTTLSGGPAGSTTTLPGEDDGGENDSGTHGGH